jgi:hypothetical protein
MIKLMLRLAVVLVLFLHAFGANAENAYRLTGMARIYDVDLSTQPNIELPVNPAFSSVLTLRGDSFYLNYDGASTAQCSAKIEAKYPFSFNRAPLGSPQVLNKFLEEKFRINSNDWSAMYLLKDANSPDCAALRFSRIYTSNSEFVLLNGDFLYVFEPEKHRFRDASEGFDCGLAKTAVEHLICGDPRLQKMDANVNYGYVLMQRRYSKEISYQDPVRIDQISWVANVRNKCTTADCLLKAYSSRIKYIKGKVSDSYPSYPEEEDD